MNVFLKRYQINYDKLWNSLDVTQRKRVFREMLSEINVTRKIIKKQEMINVLSEYHYNKDNEIRESNIIPLVEYSERNVSAPQRYRYNYPYDTDQEWVTLCTNCCCNYVMDSEHAEYAKFEMIGNTRHFMVNFQQLPFIRDSFVISHINLHLRSQASLYILSVKSRSYLRKFIDDAIRPEFPIDNPKELNINLFDYQRKTINWMRGIEERVKSNEWLSTTILPKNSIKIPNYPIYYNTSNSNYYIQPTLESHHIKFKGGILGDELGLGKTLTSIGLILNNPCNLNIYHAKQNYTKATLIAMPSHLIEQWANEIESKCVPSPKIITLTTIRDIQITIEDIKDADIVLISYQLLMNRKFNTRFISYFHWYRIMIDEGHELLNNVYPASVFNFLCRLHGMYRWYISGTPFINYNARYLSYIADFLHVQAYGKLFYKSILNGRYTEDILDENKLKLFMDNLFIRNTKKLINDEYQLPELNTEYIKAELSPIEMNYYNHVKTTVLQPRDQLRKICCHMQLSDNAVSLFGDTNKTLLELKLLMVSTRENEINNLTKKLSDLNSESKETPAIKSLITRTQNKLNSTVKSLNYLQQVISDIDTEQTCSICFETCKLNSIIKKCSHVFCSECMTSIINTSKKCPFCRSSCDATDIINIIDDNYVPPDRYSLLQQQYGTKTACIIDYIEKRTGDDKILIFCEWDRMLDKITKILNHEGHSSVKCNGSIHRRNNVIHQFKYSDVKIMALSTENTASGINLTEAKHIIFINMPDHANRKIKSLEEQAISRSYRLGQTQPVNVIHFIIKNTIEEELL